ncbi:MAG: ATP-binding protein [Verrucomicrobiota bacterium]
MNFFRQHKLLIATGLALLRGSALAQIAGQPSPAQPARIVTRYVLTSTSQGDEHDPTAWRLLASNDGGGSWTILDVQTNQQFIARSQPVLYRIDNRQPYETYRLQIDAIKLDSVTLDMSAQLSGFRLLGSLVNVSDESRLQMRVVSSCADPMRGPPEFALDDDPTTDWCDYGLGSTGGCWLQVSYATESETEVTNLSQAEMLVRLPPTRVGLTDGGSRVISNLVARVVVPQTLTGYALTSANDEPERDPRTWKLLGSDDGATWTPVDQRLNESFTGRFERRVFNLTRPAAFRVFRLQIDACPGTNGYGCQIADVEPLYADGQAEVKYSLVVSSSSDNPPLESAEMAFDHNFRTKWLSFNDASVANPCWLQWQLTPREEEWPVISQRQVDLVARRLRINQILEETNIPEVSIHGYALTSANDYPARDPSDWKLLGSKDQGKTWEILDARQHEQFAGRFQRRSFSLAHPVTGQIFRLQIESVSSPTNGNAVQLAEVELLFDNPKIASSLTVLVSSQNENFPLETADNLFDGNVNTKWLDSALAGPTHASWIEWHYAQGADPGVIDLDREMVTQSLSPKRIQLRLAAAVLFTDPAKSVAGLGDQTGFEWVHLDPWPAGLGPGAQIEFNGDLQIRSGALFVSQVRVKSLGPLPTAGNAVGALAMNQDYFSGSVTGRISSIFSGPFYCGATLTLTNHSSVMVRLPGTRFPLPPEMACPVKVIGTIEYLIAPDGARVPGVLWLARPETITLAPQTEDDWNQLPEYSPSVPLPAAVCLHGTLKRGGPAGVNCLQVDTNCIPTDVTVDLPGAANAPVKAAGWLDNETGQPILEHASVAAAGPTRLANLPQLKRISEVRQFINRYNDAHASANVRGVVTYIDLALGEFYLQDGPDAILVRGQLNAGLHPKLSEEGNYVELHGVVEDDDLDATGPVRLLGKGQLPEPVRPSWDHLLSGENDARWVEVEGVITEAKSDRIALSVAGGQLVAWINELDSRAAQSLPGSLARIRGVCAPIVNTRNQRLGMRLLVPSLEFVDLLRQTPEEPFALPSLPINAVMSADPANLGAQRRYARTQGVVTCQQGRLLFLQDKTDGLRAILRDDAEVAQGDAVEVVGVPQPDGFSAKFTQAVVRKTGRGTVPEAVPIDLAKVTMADLAQQRDAMRVTLEAILVNESTDALRRTLNLRSEQAREVFSAYLPAEHSPAAQPSLPVGSRLRLQGVLKAIQDKAPDLGQTATSFELYLNSASDIAVLERPSWWTTQHMLQLSGVFAGFLAVGLAWIWLLRNQVRQRTRDLAAKIEELKRSELSLAAEVAGRKRLQADADKAHKQLLAVARQAGMAEVATGILHNVGNVLNSVNVSSTLVMELLRNSHPDGLEKAVAMLRQNETELGAFFKIHEKGQKLLPYLQQLAGHLSASKAGALHELQDLDKNIQHIKEIVAVQQDYAKFAGLTEQLPAAELVEDALLMNASSLEQHQVKTIRQFDPLAPPVEADRHKVLQILVNLIRNARQACEDSGMAERRIGVVIQPAGQDVQILITDNGAGIPAGNLDRIFSHGFTTRKEGHGFGLHNAALAATEMGGSLQAASRGTGQGATFTLTLPAANQPPQKAVVFHDKQP